MDAAALQTEPRVVFFPPHDEPSCFIKDWFHAPLWTLDDWLLQHIFRNLDLPLFCSFFWGGWHITDCSFRKVLYIIL